MKRVYILVLLFVFASGFSQSVLEPGIYKANVKGQKLMLKVFEDNKYEMAVFFGRYIVENDTITFRNRAQNESAFKIKVNEDAEFSSTLKIKFENLVASYMASHIYIGTQKDDDSMVEYKPIIDYGKSRFENYNRSKDFKIDVEKTKYLYFVEAPRRGKATISKFQINPNANEIIVDYDAVSLQNVELKGVIDPETKKLSVTEGRTENVIFEFEKDSTEETKKINAINPVTVLSENNWLKNNGFAKDTEFDSSYLERRVKTKYNFRHSVLKTYAEALKSIEKTPEKFLVIVVDNGKRGKVDFDKFIKEHEETMSLVFRNGYDLKKDYFNFYLVNEKDKPAIENFKITDKKALLFFNSNGVLLYHTVGTIADNSDLFRHYYSVYEELKRANSQYRLDKLMNEKKASIADFKKTFLEIIKTKKSDDYYVDGNIAEMENVDMVEAVDTAATAPLSFDDNYLHVNDPENLYAVKTPKKTIIEKWNLIVDFYTKSGTYDEDFIELCKREFLNNGFTYKLYGGQKMIAENDFKILDYLYKNYDEIRQADRKKMIDFAGEDFGPNSEISSNINPVLSSFLKNMTTESASLHRSDQIKMIGYYKRYLQLSGYNLMDFKSYLASVKESNRNDNSLYFKEFHEFFQTIESKNPSLIETLDEMYTAQKNSFVSWPDFKDNFSRLMNEVAWDVVETKNNDIPTIQNAIRWSEASLKVDKDSPYYLDTLGQLYYKNNEKGKAILTEEKAVNALKNDNERTKEYGDVLERMKNGTY